MDESSMELYISLKQGLEDIENGKTRPFSEALDEIKSRRNRIAIIGLTEGSFR